MQFSKFRWYFLEEQVILSKNDIDNEKRNLVNSGQLEDDQKTLAEKQFQSTTLKKLNGIWNAFNFVKFKPSFNA